MANSQRLDIGSKGRQACMDWKKKRRGKQVALCRKRGTGEIRWPLAGKGMQCKVGSHCGQKGARESRHPGWKKGSRERHTALACTRGKLKKTGGPGMDKGIQ